MSTKRSKPIKTHTLALLISRPTRTSQLNETTQLVDIIQDEGEINCIESALKRGEKDPLKEIHQRRSLIEEQETLQGDMIEELLSQPFVKPHVQEQGLLWLKSKIKLDTHRKAETEAVEIIAQYAYQLFKNDPSQVDFILVGPNSQVRIRIFDLPA